MATSTNDDKGVTISPTPAPGSFSAVTINPGALTLADEELGVIYERGRAIAMGEWSDIAYSADSFIADGGGTWTVQAADVKTHRYAVIGDVLHFNLMVQLSSVASTPPALRVRLPLGFITAAGVVYNTVYQQSGVLGVGIAQVVAGQFGIYCYTAGAVMWSNTTNATDLHLALTIPVSASANPNPSIGSGTLA